MNEVRPYVINSARFEKYVNLIHEYTQTKLRLDALQDRNRIQQNKLERQLARLVIVHEETANIERLTREIDAIEEEREAYIVRVRADLQKIVDAINENRKIKV